MNQADLIAALGLEPLPVEGGLFRQTWRGVSDATGKPCGTAITAMLTDDDDSFSALHRLSSDEVWHFQLGDPMQLLLLWPDLTVTEPIVGPDVLGGHLLTLVVPAGVWMGASLVAGGRFCVFACTMAPGFSSDDYEGGQLDELASRYRRAAVRIGQLVRPGEPNQRMPEGL